MIEDARSQAITIASEQEIVRISQQQADAILAEARELERETRAGAEDYADEVFSHVEQSSIQHLIACVVAVTASMQILLIRVANE